jgi:hypothetical protein
MTSTCGGMLRASPFPTSPLVVLRADLNSVPPKPLYPYGQHCQHPEGHLNDGWRLHPSRLQHQLRTRREHRRHHCQSHEPVYLLLPPGDVHWNPHLCSDQQQCWGFTCHLMLDCDVDFLPNVSDHPLGTPCQPQFHTTAAPCQQVQEPERWVRDTTSPGAPAAQPALCSRSSHRGAVLGTSRESVLPVN